MSSEKPAPEIDAIDPAFGPPAGDTLVSIRGRYFTHGTRVFFGPDAVDPVVLERGTLLLAKSPVSRTIGPVDVRVERPDGAVITRARGFVYGTLLVEPAIERIEPNRGSGGEIVLVTGQRFVEGARVEIGGDACETAFVSSTQLRVRTPRRPEGIAALKVVHPDGASKTVARGFLFLAPSPPPRIASVEPARADAAGGSEVTVVGGSFARDAKVFLGGVEVATRWIDAEHLRFTTPESRPGRATLMVVHADGSSATLENALELESPPPSIQSITPARGPLRGKLAVRILGSWFHEGARVELDGAPIASSFKGRGELQFVTPPRDAPGVVELRVVNPDGKTSDAVPLAYEEWAVIDAILPAVGPSTGGTRLEISGRNFKPGSRVEIGGKEATITNFSEDRIEVVAPLAMTMRGGAVDVRVIEPEGSSKLVETKSKYVYERPAGPPKITRIEPAAIPSDGGRLAIVGDAFVRGCVVELGGIEVQVTFASPERLEVIVTPQLPGRVDVRVVNPDGASTVLGDALELR